MAEKLDLILTLSTEEDLMEAVLLFLGVTSLLNIELSSNVFRSHMKKTLTWKKKLKQVWPEYFSNELPDCVKEKLGELLTQPDCHEKFKAILLRLNMLRENRKTGNHNLNKVNVNHILDQDSRRSCVPSKEASMDSKCVLLPGVSHKGWFTDELEHHNMNCDDDDHKVKTQDGIKDCFCHDGRFDFSYGMVCITSEYIYMWKREELMVFQKSNFQLLKSWVLPISEMALPVRLNVTEKYFQFFFLQNDIFMDMYEKKKIEDNLGPRIIRCSIGKELLHFFDDDLDLLGMLNNSEFDENHLISQIDDSVICIWNFSLTEQNQKENNFSALKHLFGETDQDDDSDVTDQDDDSDDEDEVLENDCHAQLVWSKTRSENTFPLPKNTSVALKFPIAYIGKSNGKCEVWNIEDNVKLNVLYLGDSRDGSCMAFWQIFPVGDLILTVTSVGWLCAFNRQTSEEVSESYIEPLWRKTNSGNGRKYVKVFADETRIVSLQTKDLDYTRGCDTYIAVMNFWGKVGKKLTEKDEKKRALKDADLGEGSSRSAGKSDNKVKKRKLPPRDIPAIQIEDDADIRDDIDDYDYAEPEEYLY